MEQPGVLPAGLNMPKSACGMLSMAVILSGALAIFLFLPWLVSGLHGGETDAAAHYYWGRDFASAWLQGIVLPGWASSMYQGLGSPVLLTYPPLFYMLTALVNESVGDVFSAMVIVLGIANFASGLAAFLLMRSLGMAKLGLLAALAVQASPLTSFINHAVNGWPTYLALPFTIVLVYLTLSLRSDRRIGIGLSLSAAGLCLAHTMHAFNTFIVVGLALVFDAAVKCHRAGWRSSQLAPPLKHVLVWSGSVVLGVGLVCPFLVPAIVGLSQLGAGASELALPWNRAFLLSPVTTWRYGLYWPLVQVVLPGAAAALLLSALVARGRGGATAADTTLTQQRSAASVLLWAALVATFFTSELSYPLWKGIGSIRMNQLPQRYLLLSYLLSSISFLVCWGAFMRDRTAVFRIGLLIALSLPIAITGLQLFQFYYHDGRHRSEFLDQPKSREKLDRAGFAPATHFSEGWRKYIANGGLVGECARLELVCTEAAHAPHRKAWLVRSPGPASVQLPLFWFPNWSFHLNGERAAVDYEPATGLARIQLGAGDHRIDATWEPGPQRDLGTAIAVVSAILLLAGGLSERRIGG